MGRKSSDKTRTINPEKRRAMAAQLLPFLESGPLEGITTDALAQRLGRSKATIYKYFRSREELFELALDLKLERVQGFVPLLMDQDLPFLDRYHRALGLISAELSTVNTAFLADLRRLFPMLWAKVEQVQFLAGQILGGYYREGVEKGILEPIHPAILAMSDRFLFDALCDPDFLAANGLSIREAFEEYFKMKFFGLVKG